jgi:hypothetical protein
MLKDALVDKKRRGEGGKFQCSMYHVSLFRILSVRYDMISMLYPSLSAGDGEMLEFDTDSNESLYPSPLFSRSR